MVEVTSSGPACSAGTRLSRLVVRLLLVAGCSAAGWLASVLLAGTASADTGLPISINVPGISVNTPTQPAKKPARTTTTKSTNQGVGGLVGGLLSTVTTTVNNVTTTVTTTVNNVTTTVTNTVNNVVSTVTDIPKKVLPPTGSPGGIGLPILPGGNDSDPRDAEKPTPGKSGSSAGEGAQRSDIAPVAAPEAAPAAVEAIPATERPHAQLQAHTPRPSATAVRQVADTHEQADPADHGPSPLPTPTAPPMAPVAPSPSFASGNDGGAGARGGVLATLAPQTSLAPPPLVGRLDRQHPVAERGRTPGLPVTSPD